MHVQKIFKHGKRHRRSIEVCERLIEINPQQTEFPEADFQLSVPSHLNLWRGDM
jgi:hypothetical protein